jgi:hypothetical protein
MAKLAKPPDPLKRRHLVEETLPPARALALAEAYLAAGQRFDALAFLAKAGAPDRLRSLRAEAVAEGDVFLVREIGALLGEEADAATWSAVAEAAAAAGKERYAAEARRLAAARAGERTRAP